MRILSTTIAEATVSCAAVQELFSEYIDGELLPIERELVKTHSKHCAQCQKQLNQLKIIDWNLRYDDAIEIPKNLSSLREQTIEEVIKKEATKRALAKNNLTKGKLLYQLQQNSIRKITRFVEFIPGSKIVKHTSRKVGESINQQISSTSKSLLKRMVGF